VRERGNLGDESGVVGTGFLRNKRGEQCAAVVLSEKIHLAGDQGDPADKRTGRSESPKDAMRHPAKKAERKPHQLGENLINQ